MHQRRVCFLASGEMYIQICEVLHFILYLAEVHCDPQLNPVGRTLAESFENFERFWPSARCRCRFGHGCACLDDVMMWYGHLSPWSCGIYLCCALAGLTWSVPPHHHASSPSLRNAPSHNPLWRIYNQSERHLQPHIQLTLRRPLGIPARSCSE